MLKKAALALAVTLASMSGAMATDGCTTAGVNYRSGPSVDYQKLGSIPAYTDVSWDKCTEEYGARWCLVYWANYEGWVAARYLSTDCYYAPPKKVYVAPKKYVAPKSSY